MAKVDHTLAHKFEMNKMIKYEEPNIKKVNLGEKNNPQMIMIKDNWDPVLKVMAFKIFIEYKDTFAWKYKDLKGMPLKLCIHRIPLVLGAQPK